MKLSPALGALVWFGTAIFWWSGGEISRFLAGFGALMLAAFLGLAALHD